MLDRQHSRAGKHQPADRNGRIRRAVFGLMAGLADPLADDDPAIAESQGQGLAIGRDSHGRERRLGNVQEFAAGPCRVERPEPSVRTPGDDLAGVGGLTGASEPVSARHPLDGLALEPGLRSQRRFPYVPQRAAAIAIDRDEMKSVGEHRDLLDPPVVRLSGDQLGGEVALPVVDRDPPATATGDQPAIVVAQSQRGHPHLGGVTRQDAEQRSLSSRPDPDGRVLTGRDDPPAIRRRDHGGQSVGVSDLEHQLGPGFGVLPAELVLPQVQRRRNASQRMEPLAHQQRVLVKVLETGRQVPSRF